MNQSISPSSQFPSRKGNISTGFSNPPHNRALSRPHSLSRRHISLLDPLSLHRMTGYQTKGLSSHYRLIMIMIRQQTLIPSRLRKRHDSIYPCCKRNPTQRQLALHQRRQHASSNNQQPTDLHRRRSTSVPSRRRILTSRCSARAARHVVSSRASNRRHSAAAGGHGESLGAGLDDGGAAARAVCGRQNGGHCDIGGGGGGGVGILGEGGGEDGCR